MDVHTLAANMSNQAIASIGAHGAMNVQEAIKPSSTSQEGSGDSVQISAEGRAMLSAGGSSQSGATQSTSDTVTRHITKLQQQVTQLQGSANLPDGEKRSKVAALRSQIMQLQAQLPTPSAAATT